MGFEGKSAAAQASIGDDLWEMHAAGEKLAQFTEGRTLEDYAESEVLRAVVASMLGVMGGALERLAKAAPECAARVDGPDLLALCFGLGKGTAEPVEAWGFVRHALPELRARVLTELDAWHQG